MKIGTTKLTIVNIRTIVDEKYKYILSYNPIIEKRFFKYLIMLSKSNTFGISFLEDLYKKNARNGMLPKNETANAIPVRPSLGISPPYSDNTTVTETENKQNKENGIIGLILFKATLDIFHSQIPNIREVPSYISGVLMYHRRRNNKSRSFCMR